MRNHPFYGDIDAYAEPPRGALRLRDLDLFTSHHEQFHGFQGREFTEFEERARRHWSHGVDSLPPEWYAKAEVEQRILRDALAAPSADSVRDLLRRYLAVRDRRLSGMPEVAAVERFTEWREGTADLVGLRAAALALHADRADEMIAAKLKDRLPVGRGRQPYIGSGRFYGTGATQAHLLGRLGVAWEVQVQGGAYLDSLLTDAVGYRSAETASLAETALDDYGYAELVRAFSGS